VRYHYQMMTATTRDPYAPVDPAIEQRAEEIRLRPYRKIISGDAEQGFLIQVPDLPGCMTAGETEQEALEMLGEAMAGWLESALVHGDPIPEPVTDTSCSGRLVVRMPKTLHQHLAEQAADEGVSLNQLVVAILARGLR
jgi:antitoxin HicB